MTQTINEVPPKAKAEQGNRAAVAQKPEVTHEWVAIAQIQPNEGTQIREGGTDAKVVARYAEIVKEAWQAAEEATPNGGNPIDYFKSPFPDIVLFTDGNNYWPGDGHHRRNGFKEANVSFINAEIRYGTLREAQLYALGANAEHGLPRSDGTKRRAVLRMLDDPEWKEWSSSAIAETCKVSRQYVNRIKSELSSQSGNSFHFSADNPTNGAPNSHINPEAPKKHQNGANGNGKHADESDEQGGLEQGSVIEVDGYGRPTEDTPLGVAGTSTTEVMNADLPEEATAAERLTKSEENKLSDEEWLDTLPLRSKLRAEKIPERMFEEAALLWRRLQKTNNALRRDINANINTRNADPYTMRVRTYIDTPHPAQWKFSRGETGGFILW
jgi:hypothetical protein